MDMETVASMVELFEEKWPLCPKEEIWQWEKSGEKLTQFACQVEKFLVLLTAIVGRRNGLRGLITVIDPSQPIVADRLVAHKTIDVEGDGFWLPLEEMRDKIRRDQAKPIDVCLEHMRQTLAKILESPQDCTRRIGLLEINDTILFELPVICTGVSGQGKRR